MYLKKGQNSAEYLIVLALVLLVALILVVILAYVPSTGDELIDRTAQLYWQSTPIAITKYAVAQDGTVTLLIKNNKDFIVRIQSIKVDGHEILSSQFSLGLSQSKEVSSNMNETCDHFFSYDVIITYKDISNDLVYNFTGEQPIKGKCASTQGSQTAQVHTWIVTSQSDFDSGTYAQTYYNSSTSAVETSSNSGTYTSEIYDAGSSVDWDNISWNSETSSYSNELNYFNDAESKNYYSLNQYSVRHWYNVSQYPNYSNLTVIGVFDCDGTCSGMVQLRIGNSTSWEDVDFLDSSNFRTDGTTSDYTWYNKTYQMSKKYGDYFFVQELLYSGSGTVKFLMDESGPSGPDPEYRSGSNGDGTQSGWTDDNGDYAIKILITGQESLGLSVRSCDDSSCSGESWTDVDNPSPQDLSLSSNRYFQFKYDFFTDDPLYSPRLYNVTVSYE